ncbi:MAG: hypothetical protein PVG78_13570 [Desulfobacterales bacterium]|jgi:hypothetical protein
MDKAFLQGFHAFPAVLEPGRAGFAGPPPSFWTHLPHVESMASKKRRVPAFYCAECKKICGESGRWEKMEPSRDPEKAPADFCLSLCPKCSKKIYPKNYHLT